MIEKYCAIVSSEECYLEVFLVALVGEGPLLQLIHLVQKLLQDSFHFLFLCVGIQDQRILW